MAKNVRDFGAIGNGKANDYGAFKKAFELGGTVYVPSGKYLIEYGKEADGTLTPSLQLGANCHLVGDGKGATSIIFSKAMRVGERGRLIPGLIVGGPNQKNMGIHNISFQGIPSTYEDEGQTKPNKPCTKGHDSPCWLARVDGVQMRGEDIQVENGV